MGFVRGKWEDVRVGDKVSLYCGLPLSVNEVMPPPPKAPVRKCGTVWYEKRRKVWVITLRGPRFGDLVVDDATPEFEVICDQPLWLEKGSKSSGGGVP